MWGAKPGVAKPGVVKKLCADNLTAPMVFLIEKVYGFIKLWLTNTGAIKHHCNSLFSVLPYR